MKTTTQETTEYTIDANGRSIGRVATEAARVLMGKDEPNFERHTIANHRVHIVNASKLSIDEKKRRQKVYVRYSGYPGGQKRETLEELLTKKGPEEVCRRAIYGMLPANRHRDRLMKRVTITQ